MKLTYTKMWPLLYKTLLCPAKRASENPEVWKPKYGNQSTETKVRK